MRTLSDSFKTHRLTPDTKLNKKLEIQTSDGTWHDVTSEWIDAESLSLELDTQDSITSPAQFIFTLTGNKLSTYVRGDKVRLTVYFESSDTYTIFEGYIASISVKGRNTTFTAYDFWYKDLDKRLGKVGFLDSKGNLIPLFSFTQLRKLWSKGTGYFSLISHWKAVRDFYIDPASSEANICDYQELMIGGDVAVAPNGAFYVLILFQGKATIQYWETPVAPKNEATISFSYVYDRCKIVTPFPYSDKVAFVLWDSDYYKWRAYRWQPGSSVELIFTDSTFPNYNFAGGTLVHRSDTYWMISGYSESDPDVKAIFTIREDGSVSSPLIGLYSLDTDYRAVGDYPYYYGYEQSGSTKYAYVYDIPNDTKSSVPISEFPTMLRTADFGDYCVTDTYWMRYDAQVVEITSDTLKGTYWTNYADSDAVYGCKRTGKYELTIFKAEAQTDAGGDFTGISYTTSKIRRTLVPIDDVQTPYAANTDNASTTPEGTSHHFMIGRITQISQGDWKLFNSYLFFLDESGGRRRYFHFASTSDPYNSDAEALADAAFLSLLAVRGDLDIVPLEVSAGQPSVEITDDLANLNSFSIDRKYNAVSGQFTYPYLNDETPRSIQVSGLDNAEHARVVRFARRVLVNSPIWEGQLESVLLIETEPFDKLTLSLTKMPFSYSPSVFLDGLTYRLPKIELRFRLRELDPDTRLYLPFEEGHLDIPAPEVSVIEESSGFELPRYYCVQAFDGASFSDVSATVEAYSDDFTYANARVYWDAIPGAISYRVWYKSWPTDSYEHYVDVRDTEILDKGSTVEADDTEYEWQTDSSGPQSSAILYTYDYSPKCNHGVCTGITCLSESHGVLLDGSSSYIDAGYRGTGLADELTVLVACKMTKLDATQVIVHRGEHGTSGYHIYNYYDAVADTNRFIFRVIGAGGSVSCSEEATFNDFVTLALTYKSGEGGAGYVDGEQVGVIADSGDVDYTNDSNVGIGANIYSTPQYFFGGEIYEVRIIARKYSQSEIQKWHNEVKRKFS